MTYLQSYIYNDIRLYIDDITTIPMWAIGRAVGRRNVRVDWTRGSEESCGRENSGTVVTKYTCKMQIQIHVDESFGREKRGTVVTKYTRKHKISIGP